MVWTRKSMSASFPYSDEITQSPLHLTGVRFNNSIGGGHDLDISIESLLSITGNGLGVVLGRGNSV